MARILGVDDDPLARAVLADLLIGLGHEAVPAAGAAEALAALQQRRIDLVITDILMPDVDGFELAQRVNALPDAPPVLLMSGFYRGDAEAQARAAGINVAGFVSKPVDPDRLAEALGAVIGRTTARPRRSAPMDSGRPPTWAGAEFLADAHGTVERVPPLRMLFLAHRVSATGALVVDHPLLQAVVVLRNGRLVHVEGIPGLVRAVAPQLQDQRHLGKDLAAAIAAGHDAQRVMEAAAEAVGDALARLVTARGGKVRFDADVVAPAGAFPLPLTVPRLIAAGLRTARPVTQIAQQWEQLGSATVRLRIPDDSTEDRWGLDPTAMRVLRVAAGVRELGGLLRDAAGADPERRAEVIRAIDLLYLLGILLVDGGPLEATAEVEGEIVKRGGQTEEDPRMNRLRASLAAMEGMQPIDVLELRDKKTLTEDDVALAFRDVSRRFHPDQFFGAPPIVKALAEACFTRVSSAYDSLRAPGALAEARRILDARAAGRQYVSDRDAQQAKLAFRRGELLFRNRDWRGSDALYVEAVRLDPTTWPYALCAARSGYLSRRLTAAEAITQLDQVEAADAARRSDVLVAIATIHKLEGRHDEGLRLFKEAMDKNPDNRDAQREVRLAETRSAREKAAQQADTQGGGLLASLLRRKT